MNTRTTTISVVMLLVALAGCSGPAEEPGIQAAAVELTADEKVAELERMCAEAQPAMEARQAEATLYERVGGRDGIQIVVEKTVSRHLENEQLKHMFVGVDIDRLETLVTDFLVIGTGGEGEYHGRNMADAHARSEISNADFLSAGADLKAAMESAGWGEGERQELLCAFVGLRGEVVTR